MVAACGFLAHFCPEIPYFFLEIPHFHLKLRNFPVTGGWLAWHLQADRPTTSNGYRSGKSSERDECLLRLIQGR